jgi:hypothetical protein
MKITLDTNPPVEIELHDEISTESLVSTLAAHPAVQEMANEVGKGSFFAAYEPSRQVYDHGQLAPIVNAYLKGGVEAAEEYLHEKWTNSPEDYFHQNVKSDLESEMRSIAQLVAEHERFEDAEDEITDALTEALEETCIDALAEADTSTIESLFGSHDKFEMSFGIDLDKLGVDDLHMYYSRKNWFSVDTLDPNANFMRMFKLFNISPSAFIEYIIEAHGYDPRSTDMPDGVTTDSLAGKAILEQANRWQAFSDVANDGIVSRETRAKFPDGSGFDRYCNELEVEGRTVPNIDRPSAMSMKQLCTLIENAGGGGVPVYTARYEMKDILSGKLDKPFIAKQGLIGIHDFVNGSGYMDDNKIEVLINPAIGGFTTRSINKTYDFVGSTFDNEIIPAEGAEWVHFVDDCWRTEPGLDGAYAEIWADTNQGGVTYWLSTYDKNRDAAGLYAESEAFDSLEEAKKVGLNVTRKSAAELEAEADVELSGPKI